MARFLHWSDLHTEYADFEFPSLPHDIDAVLFAGDTGVGDGHLDYLWKAWEAYRVPIISIWGNKELYGTSAAALYQRETDRLERFRSFGADIRVLHAETTKIKDTLIIGATLWTDYKLVPGHEDAAKLSARKTMLDHRRILRDDRRGFITPDDCQVIHRKHRNFIADTLARHRGDTTIVMTHHMPSEVCVAEEYRGDILTAAFCSNMEAEIVTAHPNFWIYGHTHQGREVNIETNFGMTRFRHNPRGYPGETSKFDPLRIIDTAIPDVTKF